jgi:hypothetical protein
MLKKMLVNRKMFRFTFEPNSNNSMVEKFTENVSCAEEMWEIVRTKHGIEGLTYNAMSQNVSDEKGNVLGAIFNQDLADRHGVVFSF